MAKIDPKRATIWWDGLGHFAVLERPADGAPEEQWWEYRSAHQALKRQWCGEPGSKWNGALFSDVGANYFGEGAWSGKPAELFEAFCYILHNTAQRSGPVSRETLDALLDAFAKIRGCEWTKANMDQQLTY
jgi:hypothetical protein